MDGAHAQATASSSTRPATLLASPFTDQITPVGPTPYGSRPASMPGSASGFSAPGLNVPQSYFHSRRVRPGEVQQPWKDKKDPKEKWVTIIPCIGLFFGLAIAGFLVWHGLRSVVNHKYCPVLMENWSNGFDEKIWTREVECGGFGNGQFDYTTNSEENSYVKDGHLHIRPTLQDEKLITTDNVMNLTEMGICTSPVLKNCVSGTNSTNGTIINPVKSARINSRKGAKIKYGRVEVSARFPEGKWLWPAIWMLPVEEKYGAWPASGEMDIAESRGNDWKYPQGGNDIISSTLHWGPDPANDAWWRTNVKHRASHTSYSSSFHTFGIEWSEKYIFTYVDSRLLQVLFTNFQTRLWERGNFPLANENGTKYIDTWSQTGRESTPFDQEFYLIINLGVGATSGWFEDGKDKKPWVDGSHSAAKDFWDSRKEWKETWKNDGEMVVKSVKMWQQCD
ncbi:concanavalin A-like lectin/glucanase [Choiromyces venosus 120613-1]|uniref:Concanavalin A-like lectin/glucanase n=1 Tax=Choiromyces venosus 120613-1 TaxID=1336337 RepID=A0A3N4JLE4_9PEZI|nr:concanavalin A-like lectin/glucanase [Choiromyces venosus 120613-1]